MRMKVLYVLLAVGIVTALIVTRAESANAAASTKVQHLQRLHHKSKTVVYFWTHRGRWARAPARQWCWEFVGERRERVCLRARASYRAHQARLRRVSRRLAVLTRPSYGDPGNVAAWLCIHGGEGAWDSNTGNGYYGGLQMDWSFMSSYGGYWLRTLGTADHWPPLLQMAVAERARASGRGYYPWPNTARACGLI